MLDKVKNNGTATVNVGDRICLVPQFATGAGASVTGWKSGKVKFATINGGELVTTVT